MSQNTNTTNLTRKTKEQIFEEMDEEITGDKARKGEVDRKMLLKGSSIAAEMANSKKKLSKKVIFKK
jgi:hypothetical protein